MKLRSALILFTGAVLFSFSSGGLVSNDAHAFYHSDQTSQEATVSEGKVVIKSPEEGAVVAGDVVEVSFEIVEKGKRGDHVHLFLDGKLQDPVYGKTYTLKGLGKGEHTIEVKLVTKNHAILGPVASVKVSVM